MSKNYSTVIFSILTLSILFPSFVFGGNRIWIWSVLSIFIFFIFIIYFFQNYKKRTDLLIQTSKLRLPILLFVIPIMWALFQNTTSEYHSAISINPEKSAIFLPRLIAYGMIFWISAHYGKRKLRINSSLYVVSIFSLIISGYGLLLYVINSETILWFEKTWGIGRISATFINPNSYVIFSGMGLLVSIYLLFLLDFERGGKKLRNLLKSLNGKHLIIVAAIISNGASIILTGSRGGILSVIFGVIMITIIYALKKFSHKRKISVFIYPIILIFVFSIFSVSGTLGNLLADNQTGFLRFEIYFRIIHAFSEFWMLGTGLGTFEDAFLLYRTPELSWLTWDYAHNAYLELIFDLGLPAALSLFTALYLVILQCWRGVRNRKYNHGPATLAISVSCMVGAHSLIDFSMQMPSIAALYALILGIGWAQSFSGHRSKKT